MSDHPPPEQPISVDICLCTYRRQSVVRTLKSLIDQQVPRHVSLRILIADNDRTPSARARVAPLIHTSPWPIVYLHAPAGNISLARNALLDKAMADWIAFIDDDETAPADWLAQLLTHAAASGADGVLASTRAFYPVGTPAWIRRLDLHSNTPETRAGRVETGHTCNALLRYRGTRWETLRFDIALGVSGGEDTCYFAEAVRCGARLSICKEAVVSETIPRDRLTLRWVLQRRYRAGQNYMDSLRYHGRRTVTATLAIGKIALCLTFFCLTFWSRVRSASWGTRAALHLGVLSRAIGAPRQRIYGTKASS